MNSVLKIERVRNGAIVVEWEGCESVVVPRDATSVFESYDSLTDWLGEWWEKSEVVE